MKRTLVVLFVVAAMLLLPDVASACAVCFGDKDSQMVKGANSGIFFLLTIIGLVQIGFVALFWSFWRRSKALQRRKEEFRLIDGGKAHA
jgi:hypothetical protein